MVVGLCVLVAVWLLDCVAVSRRCGVALRRRPAAAHLPPPAGDRPAVRTRDRHVVNIPPSWGKAVALWVEVVSSARCTPPLDLGIRNRESLDLVSEPNENHNI